MTASDAFSIANLAAFLAWIFLLGPARWMPRWFERVRVVVPAGFALGYVGVMVFALAGTPVEGGGFGSLEEVAALFRNEWVLVAGWLHYLAFDFFVGCWVLAGAREQGIPHWLTVPVLLMTFMLGPAGYLAYRVLSWVWFRNRQA